MNKVKLRCVRAKFEHIKIVYLIRNNPEIRKNLINSDDIVYFDHVKFYRKMLEEKNPKIFLIYHGLIPIGFFDIKNKTETGDLEVGFKIIPTYQGKGIGKIMMNRAIQIRDRKYPDKNLVLTVFLDNDNALNTYRKAGFKIFKREREFGKRTLAHMKLQC